MAGAKKRARRDGPKGTHPRRPKHTPPTKGRVDENEQLNGLKRQARDLYDVNLDDFQLPRNSAPGTDNRSKQKLCTPEMAKMMAFYVMMICFSYEMVETSLFCAWWWWPFLPLVSWWKRYGWGIWSGAMDFGHKHTGGCRPLMIALGWVGAVGSWAGDVYLGQVAKQSLAMFLGCTPEELPVGLKVVPYYGTLIAVCFHAFNLFFPVLYVNVACTNRGKKICKLLGYSPKATHVLLSGLVFLSKTCRDNGVEYELPREWLGHGKKKKLKYMLMFVHPSARLEDGRFIYWRIPHDKPKLNDSEATRRLWIRIIDASRRGHIKVGSSKMNPELVTMACCNAFTVNVDLIKSWKVADFVRETCGYGCRGGMVELGLFAEHYDLVERKNRKFIRIQSFKANYFKDQGLPEKDIVALVKDRVKFDAYINGPGWLGLGKYILEHGIFKLKEGPYTFVLDGLLDKKGHPDQEKIKERVVDKAWLGQEVTLKTEPLVVPLDNVQKAEVEADQEASWAKWYGCGWKGVGSLAVSLMRWHWLSFLHRKNMYPENVERPADSHDLEQRCAGGPVKLDGDSDSDGDVSDEEGDLEAGEAFRNERHGSMVTRAARAALDAARDAGHRAAATAVKPVRIVLLYGGRCFKLPGISVERGGDRRRGRRRAVVGGGRGRVGRRSYGGGRFGRGWWPHGYPGADVLRPQKGWLLGPRRGGARRAALWRVQPCLGP